jgi:hypothetical protein
VARVSIEILVIHTLLARWQSLSSRYVAVAGHGWHTGGVGSLRQHGKDNRYGHRNRCEDSIEIYVQGIYCEDVTCIDVGHPSVQ